MVNGRERGVRRGCWCAVVMLLAACAGKSVERDDDTATGGTSATSTPVPSNTSSSGGGGGRKPSATVTDPGGATPDFAMLDGQCHDLCAVGREQGCLGFDTAGCDDSTCRVVEYLVASDACARKFAQWMTCLQALPSLCDDDAIVGTCGLVSDVLRGCPPTSPCSEHPDGCPI